MYTVYERFWHWLQTFTIVGLIFTGLIIHKPAIFGIFAFKGVVQIHNVLAVILVINAVVVVVLPPDKRRGQAVHPPALRPI